MAIGKSAGQLQEWVQNAISAVAISSSNLDLRAVYGATIILEAAPDTTTAHNGTEFVVETSSHDDPSPAAEYWAPHSRVVLGAGTAVGTTLDEGEPAGETQIAVAATTGMQLNGLYRFVKDATIADSEVFYQRTYSAADYLTARTGLTNAHAVTTTAVWSIVGQAKIVLLTDDLWARVICNNAYHVGASSICWRARYTTLDSL